MRTIHIEGVLDGDEWGPRNYIELVAGEEIEIILTVSMPRTYVAFEARVLDDDEYEEPVFWVESELQRAVTTTYTIRLSKRDTMRLKSGQYGFRILHASTGEEELVEVVADSELLVVANHLKLVPKSVAQ